MKTRINEYGEREYVSEGMGDEVISYFLIFGPTVWKLSKKIMELIYGKGIFDKNKSPELKAKLKRRKGLINGPIFLLLAFRATIALFTTTISMIGIVTWLVVIAGCVYYNIDNYKSIMKMLSN
ncbi:hypothetical protein [Breznakia pachnodae]|uniref:DUF3784 domain-containing protein n=1 Tax=Breznakia pachnodae TaxID=265178 RepID=A0ABU0E3M6_9FIRM|nr:hypothetical protein [Breznakia pachnodae]MDQ0361501.1 hypothetical protein [Breznakia pachnodae]